MQQKTNPSSSPPKGTYLLTGEDDFRKRLALDRLKRKLLAGEQDTFNYEVYYGKDSSAKEIIRSLETLSLTGGRKLVVLKEPESLAEEDKTTLLSYFKRPRDNKTLFVLLSRRPASRKEKFNSAVSKYAQVYDFSRLQPNELSSWIVKEFKSRNKIIGRREAEYICQGAQKDMGQIHSLIEQLSIFAGKKEKIAAEDVEQFTEGNLTENSTFKLLDLINGRNTVGSLRMLRELLRSESNPSQIIGLLSWHIARLIDAKRLISGKVSRSEMLSYFQTGTYILNRLVSQAGNFTMQQLKRKLDALVDTDLMLKRSSIKGELLLEMLLVNLTK